MDIELLGLLGLLGLMIGMVLVGGFLVFWSTRNIGKLTAKDASRPQIQLETEQAMTRESWKTEPDRVEFEHAGLPCILRRGPLGAWCGYAAVPPGHPYHGKSMDDIQVDVHGGVTYAEACQGEICHVPKPGEPDDVWWIGFDCSHAWDLVPGMLRYGVSAGQIYRDRAYVTGETKRLAEQLAEKR